MKLDEIAHAPRSVVLAYAASRYQLIEPSPDDVLAQRWPAYATDERHVLGYHRDFAEVFRLATQKVPITTCKVCGRAMAAPRNRRHCSRACQRKKLAHAPRRANYHAVRLTDEERAFILTLRESGLTLDQVAAESGRSRWVVSRVLHAAGQRGTKRRAQ